MMGIIVNAGKVLKYGTLIFLVVLYSYDCYNNVYKEYLKLNKSLFSEIKGRISDIMEVTSLPSHLQKNIGFKVSWKWLGCVVGEHCAYSLLISHKLYFYIIHITVYYRQSTSSFRLTTLNCIYEFHSNWVVRKSFHSFCLKLLPLSILVAFSSTIKTCSAPWCFTNHYNI